jgi:hypothetical protein
MPRLFKRMNINIPPATLYMLECEAEKRQWTLPQVIREALKDYCVTHNLTPHLATFKVERKEE